MGSIKKRPDGKWRARYRDPAGREHARHFPRKVDAERWLTTIEADIVRGSYVDPSAGKVSFGEYAERWRAAQVHRPTSAAHIETILRRHAYPTFGNREIASIRPSEVQAWVKGISAVLAPSTVKVLHGVVASIFKAAIKDRVVQTSPCDGTRLPKVEPKRIEPLTTEQVEALVTAVTPRFKALVLLGAGSGVRQGEAFGLSLDRVDFLRRTLRVDRQLQLVQHGEPYLAPPKTAKSHRTIPLPQLVLDALAAHVAEFPATPVPVRSGSPTGRVEHLRLVFTDPHDRPLRRTNFSATVWRPAAKVAGLEPGVGFHALRHYYASLLIRHGESVKTVQARLGHATAAETLDTYSHLWPDSEDRTRAAVDDALGSAADYLRTESTG